MKFIVEVILFLYGFRCKTVLVVDDAFVNNSENVRLFSLDTFYFTVLFLSVKFLSVNLVQKETKIPHVRVYLLWKKMVAGISF